MKGKLSIQIKRYIFHLRNMFYIMIESVKRSCWDHACASYYIVNQKACAFGNNLFIFYGLYTGYLKITFIKKKNMNRNQSDFETLYKEVNRISMLG